ncbi:MAG: hypothetical protein JNM31_06825 [Flavobacteriales bacterium]|nr:hypothetical protein [Flavobacteriales bacterium]
MDLDPGPGIFTVTSVNDLDVFIRKVDAAGNFQWGGSFGSLSFDEARSVAIDASNHVIVTGMFRGTVDVDLGPGVANLVTNASTDAFVVKYSPAGALLWARQLGGTVADEGRCVAVDAFDNVIVTGFFGGTADLDPGPGTLNVATNGVQDIFVVKLDQNGLLLWGVGIGGTLSDIGEGVSVDPDGAVFVTGHFRNTVDFDPGAGAQNLISTGDFDAFVLKLSAAGTFQWVAQLGGTSFERGNAIAVDQNGACVVAMLFEGAFDADPGPGVQLLTPIGGDGALIKLNAGGVFQWAIQLSAGTATNCNALRIDAANNIYLGGGFNAAMDIEPGAGSTVLSGGPSQDVFAASYTSAGVLRWGFAMGGTGVDLGRGIAVDPSGAVLLAGEFATSMDVDPGPASLLITGAGQHGFTVKYAQPLCHGTFVGLKAFLQGAYRTATGEMVDSLRVRGFLPLAEPYTAMGWPVVGATTTDAAVLSVAGANAVVDWVVVELRDAVTPTNVLERRAALIQRDGDVVDVDGVSGVLFCQPPGNYHVALRHRNHLGVMTAASVALSGLVTPIDLTTGGFTLFGTQPQAQAGAVHLLWQGNVQPDNVVRYSGPGNDRDPILSRIGGSIPTLTASGYWPEDVTLDGTVKYTGSGNDRDPILLTIGGAVPTNTRNEQLP